MILGLSTLFSALSPRGAEAQGVTFALSSSTNEPGATVTASVTVSGFDGVGGAQFSLQWDPTVLSYVSLGNFGINYLAAGNFGTTPALTTNGEVSCSWDDQSGSATGTTVSDGTVMFTISFVAIGSAGSASSLALVDVPTRRQVFSAALAPLDFISLNGQVQIRSVPEISAWPTASSITYGQTLAASVLSGGAASVAGSFGFDTPGATPGAGAYPASVTFTPADTVDYPSVTQTVLVTVNPAPLTITAGAQGKTYGQALNLGTTAFTTGGLVNGDAVSAVTLTSPGAAATAAVAGSPYAITASAAVGTGLANYNISYQPGSLTVSLAPLTVTANNATRPYGAANPALSGTIAGVQNGDNITAAYTCSAGPATPPGDYPIVPAPVSPGNLQANYEVTLVNGTLTVLPAPLTVTGNNATRLYGAANPLFTGTIAGLQNGDLISASFVALAGPTSPVGDYTITAGLSAATSTLDNYNLSITLGTLQVLPAPLTITANNATRLYGAANPPFAGTIAGIQNGDNIAAAYTCSAGPTAAPGAYPIVPAPVSPGNLQTNYQVTLVNGTLTIVVPPLLQAVAQTNGTLTLSWGATAGQSYQVQYATELSQPDWTNLVIITATNSTATASVALSSSPQRFYRTVWSP